MLFQLFSVIAPVLICAVIGFIWCKQGRAFDTALVTTLVTNIGTPCLTFFTLVDTKIEIDAFLTMGAATAVTMVAFYAIYFVFLKVMKLSQKAFLSALAYGNVGNMGLPLCLLAFGENGLALAIAYFTVNVLCLFTIGVAVPAGATSVGALLRLPILYAVGAALVFMFTGWAVPEWIYNTTRILSGLTVPLMLITLGVSLAGLGVKSVPRAVMLSVMRIGVGFLVGWATAEAFGFTGAERGVLIVQCAMPVAVFNFLFAERYGNQPEEVAGSVVISTVLSFATLPFLLAFVL
ncbi:MAG: AEC family transporter [Rhodospirillales bacterium]